MDPIGHAVRQGFERAAAARGRFAAVVAAEGAMLELVSVRGREVALRLEGLGRAPGDLATAIVASRAAVTYGSAQVALSRWFHGNAANARIVAAALDILDRWEADGAPALPAAASLGPLALRERLDALDVPQARIAERAASELGSRGRTIAQALSAWASGGRPPSDRVASAILHEIEAEERAQAIRDAAVTRQRSEPATLAPAGPTNPGMPGGLGALLGTGPVG